MNRASSGFCLSSYKSPRFKRSCRMEAQARQARHRLMSRSSPITRPNRAPPLRQDLHVSARTCRRAEAGAVLHSSQRPNLGRHWRAEAVDSCSVASCSLPDADIRSLSKSCPPSYIHDETMCTSWAERREKTSICSAKLHNRVLFERNSPKAVLGGTTPSIQGARMHRDLSYRGHYFETRCAVVQTTRTRSLGVRI